MRAIMSGEYYGVARCIGLGNAVDIDEVDVERVLAILNDVGTTEYMDKLANSYAYNAVSLLETIKIDIVYPISMGVLGYNICVYPFSVINDE